MHYALLDKVYDTDTILRDFRLIVRGLCPFIII
jgi:hypothetical protein